LAFAKSIDPNATVAEEYTDTLDEYEREYREWEAIINGVECHVSSVSDLVWNDGMAAGEFTKAYYRIDTDYDYTVMKNIVSDQDCGQSLVKSITHPQCLFCTLVSFIRHGAQSNLAHRGKGCFTARKVS